MFSRYVFLTSNNLTTKSAKLFFSSQPQNTNLPVVIKQPNDKSDPDLGLLIKKYLSKDLTNPANSANVKIIKYIDKLEKLPNGKSLSLHLKGKEMENLISYVKNNLNQELSYILFISCKQFYSWLKNTPTIK